MIFLVVFVQGTGNSAHIDFDRIKGPEFGYESTTTQIIPISSPQIQLSVDAQQNGIHPIVSVDVQDKISQEQGITNSFSKRKILVLFL